MTPFSPPMIYSFLNAKLPFLGKSYGIEVDWMDSTSKEADFWEKMVNSPNTWIEATLPLRMLLIAKISK